MGLTHHNAAVSFACVQTCQLMQCSIYTSVTCAAAEPYELQQHHRAAYHHSEMAFGSLHFDIDMDNFDGPPMQSGMLYNMMTCQSQLSCCVLDTILL